MNAPNNIDTRHATKNATKTEVRSVSGLELEPQSTRRITLPAMATVAPTLMSCPPEAAVTSVMPIARIASSEP